VYEGSGLNSMVYKDITKSPFLWSGGPWTRRTNGGLPLPSSIT